MSCLHDTEAAAQRYFSKKVFWKYATNLEDNTRTEVWFQ